MKENEDHPAGTSPATSPCAGDLTDPDRLLARLSRLEGLLRDHQRDLRSRQANLREALSRAGLDTPEKVDAACKALPPTTREASPATGEPFPPERRAQRLRIDRAV